MHSVQQRVFFSNTTAKYVPQKNVIGSFVKRNPQLQKCHVNEQYKKSKKIMNKFNVGQKIQKRVLFSDEA
jgi:hypothetical protein